ncbi:uncharacterized protein PF3D7_1120000-like [Impatiens glandulifera]|uniref:uncharacterized protein PF3D7_1120000-like n=1 Tax=Impatiens glandulifera TaxID=253017 RepID=UPI001FB1304B|nr:uncharacterized protein PF3D7_1120000-like [Impatiens glandulifera]
MTLQIGLFASVMAETTVPDFPGRISWKSALCLKKIVTKFEEMDLVEKVYNTQFRYIVSAPVLQFSGTIEDYDDEEEGSEPEDEHEEPTSKPNTRKRKAALNLKEAVNLKRKLAYESSPAHIPSPPSATSPGLPPTSSVGCKCEELKEEVKALKEELIKEVKEELKEMKTAYEETQTNHKAYMKKLVVSMCEQLLAKSNQRMATLIVKLDSMEEERKKKKKKSKLEKKGKTEDGKVEEMITNEMEMTDRKVEDKTESVNVKVDGGEIENDVKVDDVKVDGVKVEDKTESVNVKEDGGEIETHVKVDGGETENDVEDKTESVNVKEDGGEIETHVKVDGGETENDVEKVEKKAKVGKVKLKVGKVEKKVKVEKDATDGKDENDGKDGKDSRAGNDENDDDDFQLYNTPPKGVLPKKRVRKQKKDEDYTNPSLSKQPKTNDPLTINPLQKFDDELLVQLQNWLKDEATNDETKTVFTCEARKKLFVRVLTKSTWLKDPEIDAVCHLLRKRIEQYPKTYKHCKVSIGDCLLADMMRREYPNYKQDPENFPIADVFSQYFWGAPHRHMPEWPHVDDIYVPLNIGNKHWVLCVVRVQDNHIDVYDCDSSIYRNLDPYMRPLCEMFPRIYAMGASDAELKRYPNFNFQKLTYKRLPHPAKNAVAKYGEVPRADESGDCGVFMLMHMEYLTAGLGVEKNLTCAYVF